MLALRAIRIRKTINGGGNWNRGKKMPRRAFPLSRSRSYALGPSWDWCVYELSANGQKFNLLVALDAVKQQYLAWLGFQDQHDLVVLARLEYHPDHRGWHCHTKKGLVADAARGVVKESHRRERVVLCGHDEGFTVSQIDAIGLAFRVFNVDGAGPDGFLQ